MRMHKPSSPAAEITQTNAESTGLPLLSSWKRLYFLVLVSFILWIILLTALTEIYS